MSARRGSARTTPRCSGATVTPITPGATASGVASTPSSASTSVSRSRAPEPSAAMTTVYPSSVSRSRRRARPSRSPATDANVVPARCGVSGRSGTASSAVVPARVWARSRSKGSDRRGNSPDVPQVWASVAPSAASSSRSLLGPVPHAGRLAQQHQRLVGEQVGEEPLVGGEPRQPGLHAVEHLPGREALPLLGAPAGLGEQRGGPVAHLGGGEQLPGGEGAHRVQLVGRALIGDRERGETLDVVAPQVDPHRVVVDDRVQVDDRAAHRHLATGLDLVLAAVSERDQRFDELVAVEDLPGPDLDRLDRLDVRAESLHQRPDRRDDHVGGLRAAGAEPPQHPQPTAHRLERR